MHEAQLQVAHGFKGNVTGRVFDGLCVTEQTKEVLSNTVHVNVCVVPLGPAWPMPCFCRSGVSMQNVSTPHPQQGHADHQFVAMLNVYRDSGGLAREREVVALSRLCCGPDADTIACWVADRELMGFNWQSKTWLPLFQFNRLDMTRRPELRQVFAELTPVYDPWELASWFAQPNPWLDERIPADALDTDPSAVLQAARADRFIANN